MTDPAGPEIGPIVVAVDGSDGAARAVEWAAVEAELHARPLRIVTAVVVPGFGDPVTAPSAAELAELGADGARALDDAARIARQATPGGHIEITTEFVSGPIVDALMDRSQRTAMIVVGSHGRGAVRRAVLGSVGAALARRARCPVVVVHGTENSRQRERTAPVVVGVDGSANSVPAIELAFDEAARRAAPLIAVHAWSDTTGFDLPVRGWESIRDTETDSLTKALADIGARYPGVEVRRIVECDSPVRAILEHADGAQLIVVGSHGRGGFTGMLLGSVSTGLLHHATCPVVVVRER